MGYMFGNAPDSRSNEGDDLLIDSSTYLGIELELENIHALRPHSRLLKDNNWVWETDPSLRGESCELKTMSAENLPIRGKDVVTAVEALGMAVDHMKKVYKDAPTVGARTSTHIHVDVRDMTTSQLSRFILLYVMFEDLLLKSEAPNRKDNNYCLPISQSSDLKMHLVELLDSKFDSNVVHQMVMEWPKYSALNVGVIQSFGTVEFRIFPGCYNPRQILMWINMLLSLRKAAVSQDIDIFQIPQMVSGKGLKSFLDSVFPEDIVEHLLKTAEPRDILRGARLIQGLITRSKSQRPVRPLYKPKTRKEELEDLVEKEYSKSFQTFMKYVQGD